jgi:hypothetical protein
MKLMIPQTVDGLESIKSIPDLSSILTGIVPS